MNNLTLSSPYKTTFDATASTQSGANRDQATVRSNRNNLGKLASTLETMGVTVDIDSIQSRPTAEVLAGAKIQINAHNVAGLRAAEKAWEQNRPFILGACHLPGRSNSLQLTDGQDTVRKYNKWSLAKWCEEGELDEEEFSDPTIFFIAAQNQSRFLRLGSIAELERRGLGASHTEMLLWQEHWADDEASQRNKALLCILTSQDFFGNQADVESSLFISGMSEREFKNASLRALYLAAGDNREDAHEPLVAALLSHGVNPFDGRIELGDTPYDLAKVNGNHAAVTLFDQFRSTLESSLLPGMSVQKPAASAEVL